MVKRVVKEQVQESLAPSQEKLVEMYTSLISTRNKTDRELRNSLKELRYLVLKFGIPSTIPNIRGQVWKLLLNVLKLDGQDYINNVQLGACSLWEKIQNDVFRTLASDKMFKSVVQDECLSRVLNAFVWKASCRPKSRFVNTSFSYVQGMNVLAAPFCFVMPELDAYYCFSHFILYSCPLYVQPALEGVHCGTRLLDKCFYEFDGQLFSYLLGQGVETTVYAFPCKLYLIGRGDDVLCQRASVE